MFSLRKITTRYNESEDRFFLSALTSDESTITLCFSQRILIRLIPRILQWLQMGQKSIQQSDTRANEIMNDFAQQAAHAAMRPEKPVQELSPLEQLQNPALVEEIDIKYFSESIEFQFKNKKNIPAKLTMSKLNTRQWLIIIYIQWKKSEWPTQVWPEWFVNISSSEGSEIH